MTFTPEQAQASVAHMTFSARVSFITRTLGMEIPSAPTMRAILRHVAARHDVTEADIVGESRARLYVLPRQECMWLMWQVRWPDGRRRYSMPQIAKFLGDRDHTTVLHGIRRHQARLDAMKPKAAA